MDSPFIVILWELCTKRSRMASESVGFPKASCHFSTGIWADTRVEPPVVAVFQDNQVLIHTKSAPGHQTIFAINRQDVGKMISALAIGNMKCREILKVSKDIGNPSPLLGSSLRAVKQNSRSFY